MRASLAITRWLSALLLLGGCCIEESPALVTFSDEVQTDLERTCRLSNHESLQFTALAALAASIGALASKTDGRCTEYYGSACQFDHACDQPPDMSGGDPCLRAEVPPRPHHSCFGCGMQTALKSNALRFNGPQLALLDRVTREYGASTREEALQRALRAYAEIWLKKRKKPDFYQHESNLPHERKPDEPCRFR